MRSSNRHSRSFPPSHYSELFITTATQLYKATGEAKYLEQAKRAAAWFLASGMIDPITGLVNDGLNGASGPVCTNNKDTGEKESEHVDCLSVVCDLNV